MELIPYTESRRDLIEDRLTAEANKRELIFDRRHGLDIIIYWLRSTNQISMQLNEELIEGREFLIPNDAVMEAYAHPEAYAAKAGLLRLPID